MTAFKLVKVAALRCAARSLGFYIGTRYVVRMVRLGRASDVAKIDDVDFQLALGTWLTTAMSVSELVDKLVDLTMSEAAS